jgi:hypothetical protein
MPEIKQPGSAGRSNSMRRQGLVKPLIRTLRWAGMGLTRIAKKLDEEDPYREGRFENYPNLTLKFHTIHEVDLEDYSERDIKYAKKLCRTNLGSGNLTDQAAAARHLEDLRDFENSKATRRTQMVNIFLTVAVIFVTAVASWGTIQQVKIAKEQRQAVCN